MRSGSDHRIAVGDGISLFCGDHAGPAPVLCLPGLTRNSRDFGPLAQHLSSGRRVLTPDLRGRGRSDRDPDWRRYRLEMYVADMIALLDYLDIEKVVVIGTSLFQIIFVTGFTTIVHAINSHTVDMLLALLLIIGGVIGAQIGAIAGTRLKAEQLRILLALLVLSVSIKIAFDLFLQPEELYSIAAGVLP